MNETREDKLLYLGEVVGEVIDLLILINKTKKDSNIDLLITRLIDCVEILNSDVFDDIQKSLSLFDILKSFIKTILFIK